jgi:predicted Rossmann fold nucleotide-binding protein DprA/Smf involved in DNA uptake
MAASSLSTYLDVAQAAAGVRSPSTAEADPQMTAQAAKVIAAIHAGTENVTDLPRQTGLDTEQILATLAWLSKAAMVEVIDDGSGSLRARLTEPTKAALSSA